MTWRRRLAALLVRLRWPGMCGSVLHGCDGDLFCTRNLGHEGSTHMMVHRARVITWHGEQEWTP